MNPFVFAGLGILAAADHYGKGEIDAKVAWCGLFLCAFAFNASNLLFLPLIAVAMYMMQKVGCSNLDLAAFAVVAVSMGLTAFLGLFLSIGGVLAIHCRNGLKTQFKAYFLPFLFLGSLAADLTVSVLQTAS